jgi:nicotinate-nucleotide pyrophosphorylase (carboxylating)
LLRLSSHRQRRCKQRLYYMDWNSRRLTAILENALLEDRATRDATSYACIDANQRAGATIIAKQDCILAGIGCVARILDVYAALDGAVTAHYEVTTHPEIFDGVRLRAGQSVAVIRHNARVILSCERVLLNFLQRMSGIATLTRKFVEAVSGTRARILDTRKTAPGLRVIDKYAVRCGGGQNHRLDLSDGVLIKNNHIALAGGIVPALERAHRNRRGSQPIELEVRTLDELEVALTNGAEAILLDNMSPEDVRRAVERCSREDERKSGGRIPTECSGGVRLENVRAYAETGVDFISVGLLTHSTHAVDMSLRVVPA